MGILCGYFFFYIYKQRMQEKKLFFDNLRSFEIEYRISRRISFVLRRVLNVISSFGRAFFVSKLSQKTLF